MKPKIIICGSRDWKDGEWIRRVILELIAEFGPFTLIHGDARGADKIAARIGAGLGLDVDPYPADWSQYGRRAGWVRNNLMADQEPDLVVAFQLKHSTGTQMMIDIAGNRGIPVRLFQAA